MWPTRPKARLRVLRRPIIPGSAFHPAGAGSFCSIISALGALAPCRCPKPSDQFGLPIGGHLAIARERRQHLLVPEVLAPSLELLGRPAQSLAELGQRLAKGVRVGVGQAGVW